MISAQTATQAWDDQYEQQVGSQQVSSDVSHQNGLRTTSLRRHPLGVRPSGNALTADHDLSRSMGSMSSLPDSMILLLLEYLDQQALVSLGGTCRALFAYTSYDQVWRELGVSEGANDLEWRGSWRASLRKSKSKALPNVDCRNLFSDAVFRPFQCAQIDLHPFSSNIPARNQIERLLNLNLEDFSASWSNRPFVLTEPVKRWKVYQDWDESNLLKQYGRTVFRAEAVDWTLDNYLRYMNDTQDESPLYLFDRAFVEKMGLSVDKDGAYEPPECFSEDLFTLLKEQRPDHRWLIIGPERSGSTFHKDPNATSAWNAVIRGSKYWLMFPNSITPPGVYVSADQSEVTSPLSIAEWLLTFHEEARNTPGCIEGICGPGEVLHVPSGWWHLVVNLEPAIAITQNFVPRSHLAAAVRFLKNKPDQVSGFRDTVADPYALFMDRLQGAYPELYEQAQSISEKKRKWEDIVADQEKDEEGGGGFSFGFGDDLEEEEEED